MYQTLIIWTVICLCLFFIGRRFYRQWKQATSGQQSGCGGGCSACSLSSHCDDAKKE